jgi:hypothetical protein
MKKFLLTFIFTSSILSGIFAQDKTHIIFIDFFPMVNGIFSGGVGLGVGYEFNIGQYFAVGSYINLYSNFDNNITYNIIINGKFFPLRTKAGDLFIDAGLGYRRRKTEVDNIHCLVGLAHTGWKFIIKNNFVLEPGIGFRYDIVSFSGSETFNFGINLKAVAGWTF